MVDKNPVGAHYGTRDWLMQRITAIVMAVYSVVLIFKLLTTDANYAGWSSIFSSQPMKLATFVAILSLLLHAWVGMRDVWMDYIKPTGLRLALEVLTILALLSYVGWTIHILWGMK